MAKVCVGQIVGAHGVRGAVKLKSFTEDPAAVVSYGALTDESGRRSFKIELLSMNKDLWLARVEGVTERNGADALRGVRVFVDRAALPVPGEEEFYHADLLGLRAELPDGTLFGTVLAIHDFGAGDMLELRLAGAGADAGAGTTMVPFTRVVVPTVEVSRGRIVVNPPEGLFEEPERPGGDEDADGAAEAGADGAAEVDEGER